MNGIEWVLGDSVEWSLALSQLDPKIEVHRAESNLGPHAALVGNQVTSIEGEWWRMIKPEQMLRLRRCNVLGTSFLGRTSSSSTAGMEARIQTGALDAGGWSGLLGLYRFELAVFRIQKIWIGSEESGISFLLVGVVQVHQHPRTIICHIENLHDFCILQFGF
jgi:hypothetical protein